MSEPESEVVEMTKPPVYTSVHKFFRFFHKGILCQFDNGRFQCESLAQEEAMRATLDHLLGTGDIRMLDLTVGEEIVHKHQSEIAQAQAHRGSLTATALSTAHADIVRKKFEEQMRAQGVDPNSAEAQKMFLEIGGLQTEQAPQPVGEEAVKPVAVAGIKLPSSGK